MCIRDRVRNDDVFLIGVQPPVDVVLLRNGGPPALFCLALLSQYLGIDTMCLFVYLFVCLRCLLAGPCGIGDSCSPNLCTAYNKLIIYCVNFAGGVFIFRASVHASS